MRFWWWPERRRGWKVIRRNDITGENKVQWLHLFPLAYYWSTGGKRALSFLFFLFFLFFSAVGHRPLTAHRPFLFMTCQKNSSLYHRPLRVFGWFGLNSFAEGRKKKRIFTLINFNLRFKYPNVCLLRMDVYLLMQIAPFFLLWSPPLGWILVLLLLKQTLCKMECAFHSDA